MYCCHGDCKPSNEWCLLKGVTVPLYLSPFISPNLAMFFRHDIPFTGPSNFNWKLKKTMTNNRIMELKLIYKDL